MSKKWIGISCLGLNLMLGLLALMIWHEHLEPRLPALRLVEEPAGTLTEKEELTWVWNQPVVGHEMVGKPLTSSPVELIPPQEGEFVWTQDRSLQFTPSEPWPAAMPITAFWHGTVTNLLGEVFAVKEEQRLQGEELRLIKATVISALPQQGLAMQLKFNAPVDAVELDAHLDVFAGDEQQDFTLLETPGAGILILESAFPKHDRLQLRLRKGLQSIHGGSMERKVVRDVRIQHKFAYSSGRAHMPSFGEASLELDFTSPADLQSLRDHLQLYPPVQVSIGKGRWWERNRVKLTGAFEPGTTYQLHISSEAKGLNGHPIQQAVLREVRFEKREAGFRFQHSGRLLNERGSLRIAVDVVNETELSVDVFRIHDNNLSQYIARSAGLAGWQMENTPDLNLSKGVWNDTMELSVDDRTADIDLREVMERHGPGMYRVTVKGKESKRFLDRYVLVSDIGLLARTTETQFMVWVVRLSTGEPIPNAVVELWSETQQEMGRAVSDANGLVEIPLAGADGETAFMVQATVANELGVLHLRGQERSFPARNFGRVFPGERHEAFVYTDRGIYRHGETVHARAIVRGAAMSLPPQFPVSLQMKDPGGITMWSSNAVLTAVGTVVADVPIPRTAASGSYRLEVRLPGDKGEQLGSTSINVEAFVPPQVVVETETLAGGDADFVVEAKARYLYGTPAVEHKASASVSIRPETFLSQEFPDHQFSDVRKKSFGERSWQVARGKTDQDGRGQFRWSVPEGVVAPSALRAVMGIAVEEFSGRAAHAFASKQLHLQPYYLGLFLDEDTIDVVAVDHSGRRLETNATVVVRWERLEWMRGYRRDAQGRMTYISEEVPLVEGTKSIELEQGRARVPISLQPGVKMRLIAESNDVTAAREVWTGDGVDAPERLDAVQLEVAEAPVAPGDALTVAVHAPFEGKLLLTMETDALLSTHLVQLTNVKQNVVLPVPACSEPNLWLRASLVKAQPVGGAAPLMLSEGAVSVSMDRGDARLPVVLEVPDAFVPGQTVRVGVQTAPGAEVTVAGVDEGILRLTGFSTPDPFGWFTTTRRNPWRQWDVFKDLLPELGAMFRAGDVAMGGGGSSALAKRLNPIQSQRFRPLALWSGALRADESGLAIAEFMVPEFTGEIRWMVVAVDPTGVGSSSASTKVARPVVVQQSAPLFLAPKDRTTWLARFHNRTEVAQEVEVKGMLRGPVSLVTAWPETVVLEPNEEKTVKAELQAGAGVGVAELGLRIGGATGYVDRIELSVRPTAPFRSDVEVHVVKPGEELVLPAWTNVLASTAERSVQVSAMPALQLQGALEYLIRYPYGCLEQTVSASYPMLFMEDLSDGTIDRSQIEEQVQAGIIRLWRMQVSNHLFSYWTGGRSPNTLGSLYAIEFLLDANAQGFEVDAERLNAALTAVARDLRREGVDTRNAIGARRCWALAKADRLEHGWLERLWEVRGDLSFRARVYAGQCFLKAGYPERCEVLLRNLNAATTEQHWVSQTSQEADLLTALLQWNPWDERVPALASRIMQRQENGRWRQTYENACALRALALFHRVHPPAAGKMETSVGTNVAQVVRFDSEFRLENTGEVAVYVAETRRGVPLEMEPVENAFHLERTAPKRVERGEVVDVNYEVFSASADLEHLAIVERFPAGFEALPRSMQRVKGHLELRDDRAIWFPGKQEPRYSFKLKLRAVTPGIYVAPGTHAQSMYQEDLEAMAPTEVWEVVE